MIIALNRGEVMCVRQCSGYAGSERGLLSVDVGQMRKAEVVLCIETEQQKIF